MMRKISVTIIVRSAGLNKWNGRFILRGDSGFCAGGVCRYGAPARKPEEETGKEAERRDRRVRDEFGRKQ